LTGPQADASGRWKRYLGAGVLVFWGVLLLVLVPWLIRRFQEAAAKREIERELAAIGAKGEPTSLVEAAPPPVPDAQNAAVIFEKAFATMAANELPSQNAEAMRLAREAMKRPRCRFDLDYAARPAMLMPHLARLRHLARLFSSEALLNAHNGLPDKAAESVGSIFGLARALDEEPFVISSLVGIAINGIGLGALERIEREAPLSDPARREVLKHLAQLDARSPVTKGLVGERGASHGYMQALLSGKTIAGMEDYWDFQREAASNPLVIVEDNARLLREMTKAVDASRMPPWKALLKFKLIETRLGSFSPEEAPLSAQLLPALCEAHLRGVKLTALRDAAVIGLSCELYRSKHGRYPDKLDDLATEFLDKLPPDPFTGRPFAYRRKGEGDAAGFVVYSVGDNLKDDGGGDKRSSDKDDIVWEGGHVGGTK